MPISRRTMLGLLSSSTYFLTVSPGAAAAVGLSADAQDAPDGQIVEFPQGVASGDPQPHSVMLWTRAVPVKETVSEVKVLLQVSADAEFTKLLLQTAVHTSTDSDYTLRAYIKGLDPDSFYYYRFVGADSTASRTGRTRTAPAPDQAQAVNLAFASCQSYEQGHYGSWARMLEDDVAAPAQDQIQFVLHLGDFIYERSWHTRRDGSALSRTVPPFPDGVDTPENRYAVSLADYRHLYHTYLSDPHLQAARARWPFICTWDDHEFANNNFQGYSTYEGVQRLEAERKLWANQAWFEYIPTTLNELEGQPAHDFQSQKIVAAAEEGNKAALDSLCIYRKLSWGKYVDILLTDLRSYRSPPPIPAELSKSLDLPLSPLELVAIVDAGKAYANGKPPALLPYGDGTVANPAKDREPGSMLGLAQRDWFVASLKASTAHWKIWGNALPLIPMRLDMSGLPFADYEDSIFNQDSWAGYPYEVNYLMGQLEAADITGVVSLSGDHHMHGAGSVRRYTHELDARPVAVDFTIAGISSAPLFEDLLAVAKEGSPEFEPLVYTMAGDVAEPVWNMTMTQGVFAAYAYSQTGFAALGNWLGPNKANPGLNYVDCNANGYGLASFGPDELRVRMVTLEDCQPSFEEAPAIRHTALFRVPRWAPGEPAHVEGPEFVGGMPFPFKPASV